MCRIAVIFVTVIAAANAHAAGGHFEVDDAVMIAPGHCQVEVWASRPPDGTPGDLHAGPGCRVGPVELALNVDHLTASGPHADYAGPQIKWTIDPVASRLSTGLVWGVEADLRHGGAPARTGYAVATWWPSETLQVHANAGADWAPGEGLRTRRLGLAVEWAASDVVSLLAERLAASSIWRSRIGARINLTDALSLDLSASRSGAPGRSGIAIGLNQDFLR